MSSSAALRMRTMLRGEESGNEIRGCHSAGLTGPLVSQGAATDRSICAGALLAYYTWSVVEANITLLLACVLALRRPLRNMPISSQIGQGFAENDRREELTDPTPLIIAPRSEPIGIQRPDTEPRQISGLQLPRVASTSDRPVDTETDCMYVAAGCSVVKVPRASLRSVSQPSASAPSQLPTQGHIDNAWNMGTGMDNGRGYLNLGE